MSPILLLALFAGAAAVVASSDETPAGPPPPPVDKGPKRAVWRPVAAPSAPEPVRLPWSPNLTAEVIRAMIDDLAVGIVDHPYRAEAQFTNDREMLWFLLFLSLSRTYHVKPEFTQQPIGARLAAIERYAKSMLAHDLARPNPDAIMRTRFRNYIDATFGPPEHKAKLQQQIDQLLSQGAQPIQIAGWFWNRFRMGALSLDAEEILEGWMNKTEGDVVLEAVALIGAAAAGA